MATDARDSAIREAKRYLRDVVRNDWVFVPSTDAGAPPRSSPSPPDHEVIEWRLRDYDSSGSELEPQTSPGVASPTGYEDDSSQPASPIISPVGGRAERRRKRRREEEEEMRWNEGLRTWVERRDAWSGAWSQLDVQRRKQQQDQHDNAAPEEVTGSSSSGHAFTPSSSSHAGDPSALAARADSHLAISERDGNQLQNDREGEEQSTTADQERRKESTETGITEPDTRQQQGEEQQKQQLEKVTSTPAPAPDTLASTSMASMRHHQDPPGATEDSLIPVVPSIISQTNPIRASITPAMYPSIYSKVVVQGLTPTVPINLADVTKAMVQGWKSDGQWPAKSPTTNVVLQDDATVPRSRDEAAAQAEKPTSPESKKRSGVASAVRKVFHFSGFHPTHPFHRRSQSNGNNAQSPPAQHDGAHDQHQGGGVSGEAANTEPHLDRHV